MSRATIAIHSHDDRNRVAKLAWEAEFGSVVEFRKKSRSTEQNAKLHAMLTEVSEQVKWYGLDLSLDDWKNIFTASMHHLRVVPGIDKGTLVPLSMKTSNMTVSEMSDMIELIYAFGADPEHPVVFKEPQSEAPPHPGASEEGGGTSSLPSPSIPSENEILIRFARDILPRAAACQNEKDRDTLLKIEARWGTQLAALSEDSVIKARRISKSMRAIHKEPLLLESLLEHYSEMLDCTVADLGGAA